MTYAILSFGGFLGVGDKLFAVPWNTMDLNTDKHAFILDVDKDRLKNAPSFGRNRWADINSRIGEGMFTAITGRSRIGWPIAVVSERVLDM